MILPLDTTNSGVLLLVSTYYVPYPSTSLPILVIKNDFLLSIFLYKLYYM